MTQQLERTSVEPRKLRPRSFWQIAGGTLMLSMLLVWFNLRYLAEVHPVDFVVYRYGAELLAGGGDLYAENIIGPYLSDSGLPFTYPPFGGLALWPTTMFGDRFAYLLWSVGSLMILAWVVHRFLPTGLRFRELIGAAVFVALSLTQVVTQHLHFGQINLMLLGLCVADLVRSDSSRCGRVLPRGVLVGVATAIKLTPGLFIVYFVLTKQWRLALWSSVGAAAATLTAAVLRPRASWDFFTSVLFTLSDRVDLDGGLGTYGNSSITGALAALDPRLLTLATPLLLTVGISVLLVARRTFLAGRPVDAWVIIGLSAPLLSPVSWIHHWVWILPALLLLVTRFRSPAGLTVSGLVLLVLMFGPRPGQALIDSGDETLILPGILLRQCLMLASIAGIVLLARASPRAHRGTVVEAAPESARR